MKKILLLTLICSLASLCSCTKDEIVYESTANILGFDEALCACCGDWKIEILETGQLFRFHKLPSDPAVDLFNETFPLPIKLNWSPDSSSFCDYIIVEEFELN